MADLTVINSTPLTVVNSMPLESGSGPAAPPSEGFLKSAWQALPHPIDAVNEWLSRPSAFDALHAAHLMGEAKHRKLKPEEQAFVNKAMAAGVGLPGGNILNDTAAPGIRAGQQVSQGDPAGAAGTIVGGYGPMALAGAGKRIAELPPGTIPATVAGGYDALKQNAMLPTAATAIGSMIGGPEGASIGGAAGSAMAFVPGAYRALKAHLNPPEMRSVPNAGLPPKLPVPPPVAVDPWEGRSVPNAGLPAKLSTKVREVDPWEGRSVPDAGLPSKLPSKVREIDPREGRSVPNAGLPSKLPVAPAAEVSPWEGRSVPDAGLPPKLPVPPPKTGASFTPAQQNLIKALEEKGIQMKKDRFGNPVMGKNGMPVPEDLAKPPSVKTPGPSDEGAAFNIPHEEHVAARTAGTPSAPYVKANSTLWANRMASRLAEEGISADEAANMTPEQLNEWKKTGPLSSLTDVKAGSDRIRMMIDTLRTLKIYPKKLPSPPE